MSVCCLVCLTVMIPGSENNTFNAHIVALVPKISCSWAASLSFDLGLSLLTDNFVRKHKFTKENEESQLRQAGQILVKKLSLYLPSSKILTQQINLHRLFYA